MILTFEIFGRARNHGKKLLKLCQTSFSGIVHFQQTVLKCQRLSSKELILVSFLAYETNQRQGPA